MKNLSSRIDLLLEVTQGYLWEINKEGIYTDISPNCEKILGYHRDELINKIHYFDLYPEEGREEFKEETFALFSPTFSFKNLENTFEKKSGEVIWISSSGIPLTNKTGKFTGYWGIDFEITGVKNTENDLLKNRKFLQNVFDGIQDGLSILDTEFNIIKVNKWMEKKYSEKLPLEGNKCYEKYQNSNSICPDCPSLKTLETGEYNSEEVPHPNSVNPKGWINLSTFPMKNKHGEIIGIIESVKDITDKKRMEAAHINSERLTAIGELSAGIAHDFNNALQIISGNIELSFLEDISEQAGEYLETAKQSLMDVASRIKKLQRFSSYNSDYEDHKILDVNEVLDDAIAQTKNLWKDKAEKKGLVIKIERNYTNNAYIFGNLGEIRTVMFNIIKNSIQSMPIGGKISIKTKKNDGNLIISIKDNGIGMDEETQKRVFQPFFSTKGFTQGKGMGMPSAFSIIRDHNGEIDIKKSNVGIGTTFEMKIPYYDKIMDEKTTDETFYDKDSKKLNILWVDDEKEIRLIAKKMVLSLGHEIQIASSGKEAINLLKRNQYDILITDIGMPTMNGWQLLQKIKNQNKNMKNVVVTGWGDNISSEKKKNYNITNIVVKPITLIQLKKLLHNLLEISISQIV